MKKKKGRRSQVADEECCALCRLSEDDPAVFGEKVTLKENKMSVHYFCLLMSCGVYQRGEEHEGVFGFLVEDIKQEIRRSARLMCCLCKKKGASVGCCVSSCRRTVHFPCGRKLRFISQFQGLFPSFCPDHSPSQSAGGPALGLRAAGGPALGLRAAGGPALGLRAAGGPALGLRAAGGPALGLRAAGGPALGPPQTCSVCLDSLEPVLSYSVLRCPSCSSSWFHRDCVQRQAHSSGLFFFRCSLCSNKESFQEEMLRMGICIPERDASWELEANAYSELLEVYMRCDALACLCSAGRSHAAKTGWFQVLRCRLCGSRGTHRKCSGLKLDSRDWSCSDCSPACEGRASQRRSLMSKRHPSPIHASISCKRPASPVGSGSPEGILQALHPQPRPPTVQVQVDGYQALSAGVELVRRPDFDPTCTLSVCFRDDQLTTFPSSLQDGDAARKHFLELLVQQIQDCVVFEGPDGSKNLALDAQALREDLYFDVGCLLALSLAHGGPPVSFLSGALYRSLFSVTPGRPLAAAHMTPDALATRRVTRIAEAESVEQLLEAVAASRELLQLAGCDRPVGGLREREALVQQLVGFTMVTRMQLPLHRLREGLQTLGVFDQVQRFPAAFSSVFCDCRLSARTLAQEFSVVFSQQEVRLSRETPVSSFWRRLLLDCEVGRSSISLQDLLRFATGAEELPAAGLLPPPSISFLHPVERGGGTRRRGGGGGGERGRVRRQREELKDEGLFPQRDLGSNRLLLPVTSSYQTFKSSMEQAVSHLVHLLPTAS